MAKGARLSAALVVPKSVCEGYEVFRGAAALEGLMNFSSTYGEFSPPPKFRIRAMQLEFVPQDWNLCYKDRN